MRRAAAAVLLALLCNGCATDPPPAPVIQRIEVPVPVPCHPPAVPVPAFAVDQLALGAGVYEQMHALRAERLQRRGFEAELLAAIKACQ